MNSGFANFWKDRLENTKENRIDRVDRVEIAKLMSDNFKAIAQVGNNKLSFLPDGKIIVDASSITRKIAGPVNKVLEPVKKILNIEDGKSDDIRNLDTLVDFTSQFVTKCNIENKADEFIQALEEANSGLVKLKATYEKEGKQLNIDKVQRVMDSMQAWIGAIQHNIEAGKDKNHVQAKISNPDTNPNSLANSLRVLTKSSLQGALTPEQNQAIQAMNPFLSKLALCDQKMALAKAELVLSLKDSSGKVGELLTTLQNIDKKQFLNVYAADIERMMKQSELFEQTFAVVEQPLVNIAPPSTNSSSLQSKVIQFAKIFFITAGKELFMVGLDQAEKIVSATPLGFLLVTSVKTTYKKLTAPKPAPNGANE